MKKIITALLCIISAGISFNMNAQLVEKPDSISSEVDSICPVQTFSEIEIIEMTDSIKFPPFKAESDMSLKYPNNIYELEYSKTGKCYDWKRLWANTAVFGTAFVGTLLVLECLPEDATSWNRAEIRNVPLFKRWYNHVIKKGVSWDHDKFIFNYVLHPYAGAVYFMSARSCGFNFWQSLFYSSLISNVGWEFGIEAFMEPPSIQDMLITPLVGSLIGECFYKLKRKIVNNGYTLAGSPVFGNIVAFFIDPVNEFVGLFKGNPARQTAKKIKNGELTSSFMLPDKQSGVQGGITLLYQF